MFSRLPLFPPEFEIGITITVGDWFPGAGALQHTTFVFVFLFVFGSVSVSVFVFFFFFFFGFWHAGDLHGACVCGLVGAVGLGVTAGTGFAVVGAGFRVVGGGFTRGAGFDIDIFTATGRTGAGHAVVFVSLVFFGFLLGRIFCLIIIVREGELLDLLLDLLLDEPLPKNGSASASALKIYEWNEGFFNVVFKILKSKKKFNSRNAWASAEASALGIGSL